MDEDEFTKKKRQRMEEVTEQEDNRKLEDFRKSKRKHMTRMRNEDETIQYNTMMESPYNMQEDQENA